MLTVENLVIRYGDDVVVRGASFDIERGEFVGLVGESGAGKSTLGLSLVGLAGSRSGSVCFEGTELVGADDSTLRAIRGGGIGIKFQDEDEALHPAYTVGEQVAESIDGRRLRWRARHARRVKSLLADVGLDPSVAEQYPHELSGGQKQRALLAVALAGDPALLVADEPTSSLDTITQAHILETLRSLANERDLSVLLITHDLAVVRETCNRTLIMKDGRIVERGPARDVLSAPSHDYTATLVDAQPTQRPAVDGGSRSVGPVVAELDGVTKRYRDGSLLDTLLGTERVSEALVDVSLSIHEGETLALVGRSGAGKTTAARLIAGLETPTEGVIRLQGEPVGGVTARPREYREAVGYVFQSPRASFNPRRRVGASVAEPLRAAGWSSNDRRGRVESLLTSVGLAGYERKYPRELSGGEAQRVALARALACDPELLILDEATRALDTVTTARICELVDRLKRERELAVLAVTHDLGIARRLADRTLVVHDGRIADRGPTGELLTASTTGQTQALTDAALPIRR